MDVDLILMILAVVCFGLAAINARSPVNLVALGLLFWALTSIV